MTQPKTCKGSTRGCSQAPLMGLGLTVFWALFTLLTGDPACAYITLALVCITAYDQANLRRHLARPHLRDSDVA